MRNIIFEWNYTPDAISSPQRNLYNIEDNWPQWLREKLLTLHDIAFEYWSLTDQCQKEELFLEETLPQRVVTWTRNFNAQMQYLDQSKSIVYYVEEDLRPLMKDFSEIDEESLRLNLIWHRSDYGNKVKEIQHYITQSISHLPQNVKDVILMYFFGWQQLPTVEAKMIAIAILWKEGYTTWERMNDELIDIIQSCCKDHILWILKPDKLDIDALSVPYSIQKKQSRESISSLRSQINKARCFYKSYWPAILDHQWVSELIVSNVRIILDLMDFDVLARLRNKHQSKMEEIMWNDKAHLLETTGTVVTNLQQLLFDLKERPAFVRKDAPMLLSSSVTSKGTYELTHEDRIKELRKLKVKYDAETEKIGQLEGERGFYAKHLRLLWAWFVMSERALL